MASSIHTTVIGLLILISPTTLCLAVAENYTNRVDDPSHFQDDSIRCRESQICDSSVAGCTAAAATDYLAWDARSRDAFLACTSQPNKRADAVVEAISWSWKGYRECAWGFDELQPLSCQGGHWLNLSLTVVDSLDTLHLAGLHQEFAEAAEHVVQHLDVSVPGEVNLFETTIRILGGLLSAHYLSQDSHPELSTALASKAVQLGDRLLPALKESPSGLPFSDVNLRTGGVSNPRWARVSSLSEIATLSLEFTHLSRLSGRPEFREAALRVHQHLTKAVEAGRGLLPLYFNPKTGAAAMLHGGSWITLGARADSYYEYLLKQWVLGGRRDALLLERYTQAMQAVRSRLVRRTEGGAGPGEGLVFVGELARGGEKLSPKMDHLVCFLPGLLALGDFHGVVTTCPDPPSGNNTACMPTHTAGEGSGKGSGGGQAGGAAVTGGAAAASTGSSTEAGGGSGTEAGSGSGTEAGSGSGTEAGSGNVINAGSGDICGEHSSGNKGLLDIGGANRPLLQGGRNTCRSVGSAGGVTGSGWGDPGGAEGGTGGGSRVVANLIRGAGGVRDGGGWAGGMGDLDLAEALAASCYEMYRGSPSGLAPEIVHFMDESVDGGGFPKQHHPDVGRGHFFIKPQDAHNLLRPETVESLYILWKVTGRARYREWAWSIFRAFQLWARVDTAQQCLVRGPAVEAGGGGENGTAPEQLGGGVSRGPPGEASAPPADPPGEDTPTPQQQSERDPSPKSGGGLDAGGTASSTDAADPRLPTRAAEEEAQSHQMASREGAGPAGPAGGGGVDSSPAGPAGVGEGGSGLEGQRVECQEWVDRRGGYSNLQSVLHVPPPRRDKMESFWVAETLKYLYLIFTEPPERCLHASCAVEGRTQQGQRAGGGQRA